MYARKLHPYFLILSWTDYWPRIGIGIGKDMPKIIHFATYQPLFFFLEWKNGVSGVGSSTSHYVTVIGNIIYTTHASLGQSLKLSISRYWDKDFYHQVTLRCHFPPFESQDSTHDLTVKSPNPWKASWTWPCSYSFLIFICINILDSGFLFLILIN